MKNDITIRKAQNSDATALLDFFKKVGSETDFMVMDKNGVNLTVKEEIAYLTQYENEDNGLYLIALNENGKIIGQSALTRCMPNMPKVRHAATFGICILKEYWGKKIATTLMTQIINHAKQIGITKIELHVRTNNLPAINLYHKFSFTVEGTLKNMALINGKYYDECTMALFL